MHKEDKSEATVDVVWMTSTPELFVALQLKAIHLYWRRVPDFKKVFFISRTPSNDQNDPALSI